MLINSGMSIKRALLFNLMNSGVSFIGAGVGVWLGEFGHVTHWIYAVTAGTFLYIALGNLVIHHNLGTLTYIKGARASLHQRLCPASSKTHSNRWATLTLYTFRMTVDT